VLQVGPLLADGGPLATPHSDQCGVGQLLCFTCMQAITADTVIAYITHDDRPNISSASSQHGAKRRSGMYIIIVPPLHGPMALCFRVVRLFVCPRSEGFLNGLPSTSSILLGRIASNSRSAGDAGYCYRRHDVTSSVSLCVGYTRALCCAKLAEQIVSRVVVQTRVGPGNHVDGVQPH